MVGKFWHASTKMSDSWIISLIASIRLNSSFGRNIKIGGGMSLFHSAKIANFSNNSFSEPLKFQKMGNAGQSWACTSKINQYYTFLLSSPDRPDGAIGWSDGSGERLYLAICQDVLLLSDVDYEKTHQLFLKCKKGKSQCNLILLRSSRPCLRCFKLRGRVLIGWWRLELAIAPSRTFKSAF